VKPVPDDLEALAAGGKAALAHTLSALEAMPGDPSLARLLDAAHAAPRGLVLGLTGPPGVGKSTLTNAFIAHLRERGETVAVVAVDPSSRRSGGALLGDRIRLQTDPDDAGVFVRSMAARRRLGGLADLAFPAAVLMRALYDVVIVETVGVGQTETEIADCADLVVLCAQPGAGDALQFMKAGIMETPDVILVTKSDTGAAARRTAADLRGALSLAAETGEPPEVALVSARNGEGIEAALELIVRRTEAAGSSGELTRRRLVQTRAWAESRLAESFGQVGLAAARAQLALQQTPFGAVERASEVAREAVHEVLKKL
jgi:LAO/AO transport system kinase